MAAASVQCSVESVGSASAHHRCPLEITGGRRQAGQDRQGKAGQGRRFGCDLYGKRRRRQQQQQGEARVRVTSRAFQKEAPHRGRGSEQPPPQSPHPPTPPEPPPPQLPVATVALSGSGGEWEE
ncbi:unnamed protein product [Lampetra planeri]